VTYIYIYIYYVDEHGQQNCCIRISQVEEESMIQRWSIVKYTHKYTHTHTNTYTYTYTYTYTKELVAVIQQTNAAMIR